MGEQRMKDFKADERSNFVCHVASDDRQSAMQKHRGPAREPGVETLPLWRKVANAEAGGAKYQTAEESVRVVKAAFATTQIVGPHGESLPVVTAICAHAF